MEMSRTQRRMEASEGGQTQGGSCATERWKDGLDVTMCHRASGSEHFERTHAATQYHICMQTPLSEPRTLQQTVRCYIVHDTAISETIPENGMHIHQTH